MCVFMCVFVCVFVFMCVCVCSCVCCGHSGFVIKSIGLFNSTIYSTFLVFFHIRFNGHNFFLNKFAVSYVVKKFHVMLVNNQSDAQLFSLYVYFNTLHVSSYHVLIRRIIFIHTTSGKCHLHRVTYAKCRIDTIDSPNDEHMFARNM